MKKILIPTMIATTFMPLISIVGCNDHNQEPGIDFKGLTVTALKDGLSIFVFDGAEPAHKPEQETIQHSKTDYMPDLWFSKNNGKIWTRVQQLSITEPIATINEGQSVIFKGNNPNGFSNSEKFISFYFYDINDPLSQHDDLASLSGNIMSLIDNGQCEQTVIPNAYCFASLFDGSTKEGPPIVTRETLRDASNLLLPATTLDEGCYYQMFRHSEHLVKPPSDLCAEQGEQYCYLRMFDCCFGLKYAPNICLNSFDDKEESKNLECDHMFSQCASLKISDEPGDDHFEFFTCPTSEDPSRSVGKMFDGTGGTFKEDPVPGNTYYWYE
ncbi:MAG: hypothetical protein ACOQNV_00765 [Mycoplasmoidaceae bacterium]